jgi:hypothetical protein
MRPGVPGQRIRRQTCDNYIPGIEAVVMEEKARSSGRARPTATAVIRCYECAHARVCSCRRISTYSVSTLSLRLIESSIRTL